VTLRAGTHFVAGYQLWSGPPLEQDPAVLFRESLGRQLPREDIPSGVLLTKSTESISVWGSGLGRSDAPDGYH
jgi:hypothetical protein